MKGLVFVGDRKIEMREFADPTPGPNEVVRLKVLSCRAWRSH
jgi:hypothetical protein